MKFKINDEIKIKDQEKLDLIDESYWIKEEDSKRRSINTLNEMRTRANKWIVTNVLNDGNLLKVKHKEPCKFSGDYVYPFEAELIHILPNWLFKI